MKLKLKPKILIAEETIQKRVRGMAEEIARDYEDKELCLICVLKGAIIFLSDLMRHLALPVTVDFMAVASLGPATETSGVVKITKDLDMDIESKHVLIVEDIVDSGRTLQYLLHHLSARNAASLRVCALLNRKAMRTVEVPIDYVGFEVGKEYVAGYGLDYHEKYRSFPYIFVLEQPFV